MSKTFQQRQARTKTWFEFEDKELNYSAVDSSGSINFSVAYEEISPTERKIFQRAYWARYIGFGFILLAVINFIRAFTSTADYFPTTVFVTFAILGVGYYIFNKHDLTLLDTQYGSIVVLGDRQHDEIKAIIHEKRKTALLEWYRQSDFEDNPATEIEALEWLVKSKAMDRQEADARIAEIKAHEVPLSQSDFDVSRKKLH